MSTFRPNYRNTTPRFAPDDLIKCMRSNGRLVRFEIYRVKETNWGPSIGEWCVIVESLCHGEWIEVGRFRESSFERYGEAKMKDSIWVIASASTPYDDGTEAPSVHPAYVRGTREQADEAVKKLLTTGTKKVLLGRFIEVIEIDEPPLKKTPL